MPEMGAAGLAGHFDSLHAVAGIQLLIKAVGIDWIPEAGPAATGMKFVLGGKQGMAAADTAVNAGFVAVGIFAGEGRFGAFFATNMKLFGGQLLAPVLFGVVSIGHRGVPQWLSLSGIVLSLNRYQKPLKKPKILVAYIMKF